MEKTETTGNCLFVKIFFRFKIFLKSFKYILKVFSQMVTFQFPGLNGSVIEKNL